MNILVINAGSSSLKYQLLNPETGALLAKGLCERIGIDGKFTYKPQVEGKQVLDAVDVAMPTHSEAIQAVLNALVDKDNGVIGSMQEIDAVGHRVVHGGEAFAGSVLITDEVMKALEECIPLAPLHNPANITGINACTAVMGKDVPQVAVFDTAFHQTMPAKAYMYALPYEYYEKDKVRRYGFHGTSHKYIAKKTAEYLGKPQSELRSITMHLGNGSSMSCVKDGKCFDTSMGLTPLEGLIMGTRCGSIDPAIVPFIMEKKGLTPEEMDTLMNKKSGLLGLCGISTFVMGALTGGFFGDFLTQLAQLIHPESTFALPALFTPLDDTLMILVGAMCLGFVQILTGMVISVVGKLKRGQFLDAFWEEITWWVVFAGIALAVLGVTNLVLYAGIVLVVAGPVINGKGFGKITGIFGSLYNHVTGYFGDILSYSRLMALMLSGSVIAQVFNTLGAIPGNVVVFFIVSMAGNALNFALNLLGCYVHDLRLQCLEFFKNFYQDGGKPFRPLAVDTKYVDIQKD